MNKLLYKTTVPEMFFFFSLKNVSSSGELLTREAGSAGLITLGTLN